MNARLIGVDGPSSQARLRVAEVTNQKLTKENREKAKKGKPAKVKCVRSIPSTFP